jgi:hypothetical protein
MVWFSQSAGTGVQGLSLMGALLKMTALQP